MKSPLMRWVGVIHKNSIYYFNISATKNYDVLYFIFLLFLSFGSIILIEQWLTNQNFGVKIVFENRELKQMN